MTLVVAGVDLAAGRGRTEVAVFRVDGDSARPRFFMDDYTPVSTDEEIIAVLVHVAPAVIAIDAPLSLPRAVANALSGREGSGPASSPYTRAAERSTVWNEVGVRPLPVSFLGGLTFRAIKLVPGLRAAVPDAAIIEVFPTAALRRMGITGHETGAKGEAKRSANARMRVQRGLAEWIDGLPDVDVMLLSDDVLDALAAALTALAYARGTYEVVGDEDEGQIILPQ